MGKLNDIKPGVRLINQHGHGVVIAEVHYRSQTMVIALTRRTTEVEIVEEDDSIRLYWPDNSPWQVREIDKPHNGDGGTVPDLDVVVRDE